MVGTAGKKLQKVNKRDRLSYTMTVKIRSALRMKIISVIRKILIRVKSKLRLDGIEVNYEERIMSSRKEKQDQMYSLFCKAARIRGRTS